MTNELLSQISPSEGFSVVRKAMEDAIAFYLPMGGPALARQHVELLANSMSFYPDCTEAYRSIFYFDENDQAKKFLGQYKQALTAAGFEPVQGTPYLMKDNLVFQPNEASGGMVGLYFFELAKD